MLFMCAMVLLSVSPTESSVVSLVYLVSLGANFFQVFKG